MCTGLKLISFIAVFLAQTHSEEKKKMKKVSLWESDTSHGRASFAKEDVKRCISTIYILLA